jgi:hypothetical protein
MSLHAYGPAAAPAAPRAIISHFGRDRVVI